VGAAAAIIVRRQREVANAFAGAGATSPASARDPGELGIERDHIFNGLVRRAVLREVGNGRFYFDEPSWRALRSTRLRLAFVLVLIALGVGIAVLLQTQKRV
jgi:hypothetical protein